MVRKFAAARYATVAFEAILPVVTFRIVLVTVSVTRFVRAPVPVFVFVMAPVPVFVVSLFIMVTVFAVTGTIIGIIPVAVSVTAITIVIAVFGGRFCILQNLIRFAEGRVGPGIGFGKSPFGLLLLQQQKRFSLGQFMPGNFQPVRLLALVIRILIIGDFRRLYQEPRVFRRRIIGKMVYAVFIRPGINVRLGR